MLKYFVRRMFLAIQVLFGLYIVLFVFVPRFAGCPNCALSGQLGVRDLVGGVWWSLVDWAGYPEPPLSVASPTHCLGVDGRELVRFVFMASCVSCPSL